jgi:hypothetical protein
MGGDDMELTPGFDSDDIAALAGQLQAALSVKLFRTDSPMDGIHDSAGMSWRR